MRPYPIIACLILTFLMNATIATTLEEQFEGMKTCDQMGKLKNMYLEQYDGKVNPTMTYVIERQLTPCKLDLLAEYCINDTFYGLPVEKIGIPHEVSAYALFFKDDVKTVRKKLSRHMKILRYNPRRLSKKYPSILTHVETGRAVLTCDFSSEKD